VAALADTLLKTGDEIAHVLTEWLTKTARSAGGSSNTVHTKYNPPDHIVHKLLSK